MRYIFCLSGDYINIGKEEIASLFETSNSILPKNILVADLGDDSALKKIAGRLSLTKSIYKLLFECKIDELIGRIKGYDWDSVYNGSFCLRVHHLEKNKKNNFSEKNLAGIVWRSVNKPKVNLENPKTLIEIFISDKTAYCGLQIFKNNENFELRKPHLRPFPHPSSLHPKLARALVNLTGIKQEETLLDPFCGTGGFLIEAGLMGIHAIGYDISKEMAEGCKENLKYFKIKNYVIKNKNALEIKDRFDYVVTDLPYGLNSNVYLEYNKQSINVKSNKINLKINKRSAIKNIEQFYLKFLKNLRKDLKKKAVIIFPSYVDYKKLLKGAKFRIEKEFSIYVHRSLTRKIVKVN